MNSISIARNVLCGIVVFFSVIFALVGFVGFGGFSMSVLGFFIAGLATYATKLPQNVRFGIMVPIGFGLVIAVIALSTTFD